MAVAANERLSLTRGYKCSDLTGKLLVLWKNLSLRGGIHLGDVVATGDLTVYIYCYNRMLYVV